MLVYPVEMDDLETLEDELKYDLRDLFSLAPRPAAMAVREEEDEDEEDDESGDDSTESDESTESDTDESDEEDDEDEDEKAKSTKLIKELRNENKTRRLANRKLQRELEAMKAEVAKLRKPTRRGKAAEEADEVETEEDDPTKLTPREEQVEIKSALVDVMVDLDIDKKYRRLITALVDPDEVEIEVSESGSVTVKNLKECVEELLEDYPEWSKKASEDDADTSEKFRKNGAGRRSQKGSTGLDKASLAKKYPALATR